MAATVKWIYRGDSNTQAYYATGLRDMVCLDGSSTMPSVVAGPAGSFGNLLQLSAAVRNIEWPGQDNGPIGKAGFTFGWSGNSNFTGSISTARGGMFTLGCTRSQRAYWGGISIYINTAGKVCIGSGSRANGGNYFNAAAFNYVVSFTQNTIKEIYVTWDGTTAANGAKLWVCDRGNVPVHVASLTAGAANTELWNRAAMASISNTNVADFVNTIQADIEEIFILDEAVDVAVYFGNAARTTYLASPTGAAYEGYNVTALTAAQVSTGVAFGPGPGTLTGTLAVPTASQVLSGVAVGSTTGNVVQAAVADVRKNTTYGPSSGLTGLAYIPTAANVRNGTNVDQTTGTLAVPTAANVLSGVSVDNTTGTAIAAAAATTKHGVAANDGTGTYRGADLNTALAADKILAGNSQTQDGSTVNGTAIAAAAATTKIGVAANDGTGTYVAAERWTDLAENLVSAGQVYLANAVSKTGTLDNVTNVVKAATLKGQSLSAVLRRTND